MRILVTGASGLLGVNLALEASRDHTVFGLVNRHNLTTNAFNVIQRDLLVPGAVEEQLETIQPDWVIHCAAQANVDACEAEPEQAYKINAELPRDLAFHVARSGARLLHISTDAVFDGKSGNYSEKDAPNPQGVYARTKLAGERLVSEANPDAIIARVNLFGWSVLGRRSLGEFFYYNLLNNKSVPGFTDVFFCPLLANQLAQILLKMLRKGLSGIYHVVSSECISKYAFGIKTARLFELDENLITPASIADASLKAARSPNLTLSSEKIARALDVVPPSITEGLEAFYEQFLQGYPQTLQKMAFED